MRANLHLHSRFSDGTAWPDEIASRAAAAGLTAAALTDHDTMSGTAEFARACAELGLKSTAGVEIDCIEPSIGYKSELLAYFPNGRWARTDSFLKEVKMERTTATRKAVELAAARFGTARLSFEALAEKKLDGREGISPDAFSFNKVDVYGYLKENGAIPRNMDYKAFKKAYFDTKLLSAGGRGKPRCADVAEPVLGDGGVLVVPHLGHQFADDPDRMKKEKDRLGGMLEYFKSIGVAGVELYYYRGDDYRALNKLVKKAAKPLGFFFTYGSDCHGPGSGKDTIADFSGSFKGFPES